MEITLENLVHALKTTVTVTDVISAILYATEKNEVPSRPAIHAIFYKIHESFPEELSFLVFDESPFHPYSDKLDSILNILSISMMILPNMNDDTIRLNRENLKKSFDKIDDKKFLEECAKIFLENST